MRHPSMISVLFILLLPGCAVKNLERDQDQIRVTLLDLYTNQIMDNLIRASNGMPIIQLDYTNASANVTCKQTGTIGESQGLTDSRVLAATLSITRSIVTTISGSFVIDHTNQVAVSASPLLTSNEVYDAYIDFLGIPGSLMATCDPPPPCAAQISRKCGDKYYWVPIEHRKEFFKLALATTAQRGKALFAPTDYFPVTLKEVLGQQQGSFAKAPILTIKLDKKVPTASGFIKLNVSNKEVQYDISPPENLDKPLGESDIILLTFNPTAKNGPADVSELTGKLPLDAKLYLEYHQPKPPTTDDRIDQMNFQLQQIQFNQLRQSSSGL